MPTDCYRTAAHLLTLTALLLAANICAGRERRPAFKPPESVSYTRDIPYAGTENPRQMLDLLVPGDPKNTPLPVIVFIHGGAWRAGSKEAAVWRLGRFVESGGYAAVAINYRLTGEARWPAQIHDCKAAIRWIKANAEKYSLDPERIGLWGSSAGGHLVAMLGTSAGVAAMDGRLGVHSELSTAVACVVDFFGPSNLLTMHLNNAPGATMDHNAADSPESLLLGFPVQTRPEESAKASPVSYITPDDPPFLLVHGTLDPVVAYEQSTTFHDALKKAGVSSTLISVSGAGHGAGFGREVDREVARFFDHHLRGITSEWRDRSVEAQPSHSTF
jgi:acetyl esterase/lipase